MAPRSLASLTLSFGLVSVPVKLFTATESKSGVGFNLMHKGCGTRLKQQYVCPADGKVVERSDMVKGYEFEKDKYVIFEPSELEALEASASHTIDIVSCADLHHVLLAPGDGIILQQLLYGDEVRPQAALDIDHPDIQATELSLAQQLIGQYRVEGYDASAYTDEEKERVLAAIDQKIAGNKITAAPEVQPTGAAVIDLVEALRASLQKRPLAAVKDKPARALAAKTKEPLTAAPKVRKGVRKAAPATASEAAAAPARRTATKK